MVWADAVVDLRRLQCVQDLQQCRLVKGHRALCPFARTIAVVSLTIARWPLNMASYASRPCYLHHSAGRHCDNAVSVLKYPAGGHCSCMHP